MRKKYNEMTKRYDEMSKTYDEMRNKYEEMKTEVSDDTPTWFVVCLSVHCLFLYFFGRLVD